MANQYANNNPVNNLRDNSTGQFGEVQDILRMTSGIFDMKELLNNYVTGGSQPKKEEEQPFDQVEHVTSNFSMFGNNELPSFMRYGQDST